MAGLGLCVFDHYVGIKKWKTIHLNLIEKQCDLRVATKPPPIGAADWPASRGLLAWMLTDQPPKQGDVVLEVGSGVGLTAIGLAVEWANIQGLQVVATDVCQESLENLRFNARTNGIEIDEELDGDATGSLIPRLHAIQWDAAGKNAANLLPSSLLTRLTHVICADVVYHGGATDRISDGSGGFVKTLSDLFIIRPNLVVKLVLCNRFSGGAVAALSDVAGIQHRGTSLDHSLLDFERECRRHGLKFEVRRMSSEELELFERF